MNFSQLLIFAGLLINEALGANNIQLRQRLRKLKQTDYSRKIQHQFVILNGTMEPLDQTLRTKLKSGDLLYAVTGDTQQWFPCTPENAGCLAASQNCDGHKSKTCKLLQNEYANIVQRKSIISLNAVIEGAVRSNGKHGLDGLIINGDLTDFGHNREFTRFYQLWNNIHNLDIYPGLGNHDYQNNVDDCFLNDCADRMLKYLKAFALKNQIDMDLRSRKQGGGSIKRGSLAYSWDDCGDDNDPSTCIHFVQLNNYPTYKRNFDSWSFGLTDWQIESAMVWLKYDLANHKDKPVIINLHQYDDQFVKDRTKLTQALQSSGANIMAVFFAHYHSNVGVRHYECITGHRVPFMYSGSVPGNNYILLHLRERNILDWYILHVDSIKQTTVVKMTLDRATC